MHNYICMESQIEGTDRTVTHRGVPFKIRSNAKGQTVNLANARYEINTKLERLFLLGMCTANPEGCEWWGQAERFHDTTVRLFLGDRLGRLHVIYADNTGDIFPLIFGVNVWAYELLEEAKEGEHFEHPYGGPYKEPFESDTEAARLRDASLRLVSNVGCPKDERYILALAPRAKKIKHIEVLTEGARRAGFHLSAMTGGASVEREASRLPADDVFFYTRQGYTGQLDALARRLYQFRDELPEGEDIGKPEGYDGPLLHVSGTPLAALYATVWHHNIWDMRREKVDADGAMHTSSRGAPSFGMYVGPGTWQEGVGSYYLHVWTRDVGRSLIEATCGGERERVRRAADLALEFLLDGGLGFNHPHWKRIANICRLVEESKAPAELIDTMKGKENDGHGTMLLFYVHLFREGVLDADWFRAHWETLRGAAGWPIWQMENPEKSGYCKVLASETEAATQLFGSFDVFSNTLNVYALRGMASVADALGEDADAVRWREAGEKLWSGLQEAFCTEHPRHGRVVCDDVFDCWTWEYKRLSPLFLATELQGYELARTDLEMHRLMLATYRAQKEDSFSPMSGRQMGYGQGYLTQSTILLDQFDDMAACLEQGAAFCYHHTDLPYIVPEGVICHPSGRYWYRNGDLGNSVQQAEIVKCGRLLAGVDHSADADRVHLVPRLPSGWRTVGMERLPIRLADDPDRDVLVSVRTTRGDSAIRLEWEADRPVALGTVRLGPFSATDAKPRLDSEHEGATVNIEEREGWRYVRLDFGGKAFAELSVAATNKG